jgi:hypothetical protein
MALTPAQSAAVDVFIDACTKGQAKFASADVSEVKFAEIPETLRWWYKVNGNNRIHRFGPARSRAYLIQINDRYSSPHRLCTVAIPGTMVPAVYRKAYAAVTGQENPTQNSKSFWASNYLSMAFPELGYGLSARNLDGQFTALTISWYPAGEARARKARMERSQAKLQKKRR